MATTDQLDATLTINEIVARYPETITAFNHFGIDTCCGGGVRVAEAARRHGLDLEAVLNAVHEAIGRK